MSNLKFLLHSFLKACFDMSQLVILLFAFRLQCVAQLRAHVKGRVFHIGKYFSSCLLKIFDHTFFKKTFIKRISIINKRFFSIYNDFYFELH